MLVDTSVWIDHVRRPEPALLALLDHNDVDVHPFVLGEIACGHLGPRDELMDLLDRLPTIVIADHEEAVALVRRHRLHGRGVGWIDVHLLASAKLAHTGLFTHDRRLAAVAHELHIEVHE